MRGRCQSEDRRLIETRDESTEACVRVCREGEEDVSDDADLEAGEALMRQISSTCFSFYFFCW